VSRAGFDGGHAAAALIPRGRNVSYASRPRKYQHGLRSMRPCARFCRPRLSMKRSRHCAAPTRSREPRACFSRTELEKGQISGSLSSRGRGARSSWAMGGRFQQQESPAVVARLPCGRLVEADVRHLIFTVVAYQRGRERLRQEVMKAVCLGDPGAAQKRGVFIQVGARRESPRGVSRSRLEAFSTDVFTQAQSPLLAPVLVRPIGRSLAFPWD
jgi:hypothetical protein